MEIKIIELKIELNSIFSNLGIFEILEFRI